MRVKVNPTYFRPTEVDVLLGDPNKALTVLGWNPTKTPFPKLVEEMVDADMKLIELNALEGTRRSSIM